MSDDYQPNSVNAMFSRIMERLDSQDQASLEHRTSMHEELGGIKEAIMQNSSRIAVLEQDKQHAKGFIAAVSLLAATVGAALLAAWKWLNHSS